MAWMSNHVQLKIMGVITYPSVLEKRPPEVMSLERMFSARKRLIKKFNQMKHDYIYKNPWFSSTWNQSSDGSHSEADIIFSHYMLCSTKSHSWSGMIVNWGIAMNVSYDLMTCFRYRVGWSLVSSYCRSPAMFFLASWLLSLRADRLPHSNSVLFGTGANNYHDLHWCATQVPEWYTFVL